MLVCGKVSWPSWTTRPAGSPQPTLPMCHQRTLHSIYRLPPARRPSGFVEAGSRRGQYRLVCRCRLRHVVAVSRFDERKFAQPVMERLHDPTGETVVPCATQR